MCKVSNWLLANPGRSSLHKLAILRWRLTSKLSYVENAVILSKIIFFVCKNSHAYLQYIRNKYAWFQNDPLKTVRGIDYTNSIPYNAKSCLKWLSSKGCNSVKINSSSTKKPICTSSICPQKACKVSKRSIKNCGRSWLHKLYTVKRDERTDRQTDRGKS